MPAEGRPCKQTSLRRAVWDLLCLPSPLCIHPWDLGWPVECGCWSRASGAVQLLLEPSWSAEAARGARAGALRRETGCQGQRLGSAPSREEGGSSWMGCLPQGVCRLPATMQVTPGKAIGTAQLMPLWQEQEPVVAVFKSLGLGRWLCEGSSWPHPSFCWPWSCSLCPALLFPWSLNALLSTSLCPVSRPLVLARACLLAALWPFSLLIMATTHHLCRCPAPLCVFTHSCTFTSSLWLTQSPF